MYYFIGIGGIGMSALATILLDKKKTVSGSDIVSSYTTDSLEKRGAHIVYEQKNRSFSKDTTVIYSSSIQKDHPEYQSAIDSGCRILHRSELLQILMQKDREIVITGAHGKTTTTALTSYVFFCGKKDPSFAIGGKVSQLGSHGKKGHGGYFIVEGDESDGSFLQTTPHSAIVTNLDMDHLDFWKTEKKLIQAYEQFIQKVHPDRLFLCGEDTHLQKYTGLFFGKDPKHEVHVHDISYQKGYMQFSLRFQNVLYQNIQLSLLGEHNVLQAGAVFALSLTYGIAEQDIRQAFSAFTGIRRRLEKISSNIFDDYAHHPKEVQATLDALREAYPEKHITAIFEPHKFSRLRYHMDAFAQSFSSADCVVITDVFAAGETKPQDDLIDLFVQRASGPKKALYMPKNALKKKILQQATDRDIVITLGAGDLTNIHERN